MSSREIRAKFIRTFRGLCVKYNAWEVWSDWLVMASSAIYNGIYHDASVEEEYMRAVSRYSKEEANEIAKLLALTTEALEIEVHDFLGGIFHEMELHNEAKGQFFTPYHVCRMMAAMQDATPPNPGRLMRVSEPSCGSGAMVLAFHERYLEAGGAPERVFYELRDLDDRAFRMAYIQTSLCGLSAEIQRGNTLTLEIDRTWRTPCYYAYQTASRDRWDRMMRAIEGEDGQAANAAPKGEGTTKGATAPVDVQLPQPEQMEIML